MGLPAAAKFLDPTRSYRHRHIGRVGCDPRILHTLRDGLPCAWRGAYLSDQGWGLLVQPSFLTCLQVPSENRNANPAHHAFGQRIVKSAIFVCDAMLPLLEVLA